MGMESLSAISGMRNQADFETVLRQSLLKAEDHFSSSLPSRDASFFRARSSSMASP